MWLEKGKDWERDKEMERERDIQRETLTLTYSVDVGVRIGMNIGVGAERTTLESCLDKRGCYGLPYFFQVPRLQGVLEEPFFSEIRP